MTSNQLINPIDQVKKLSTGSLVEVRRQSIILSQGTQTYVTALKSGMQ